MKYENNYAYAGKTALAYKFITEGIIDAGDYITEIGVEYKKNSGTWTQRLILTSDNITSYNISDAENDGYSIIRTYPRNSIITIIKGLSPNTSYTVRGYYIKNGNKYTFNEVLLTTLNGIVGSYKMEGYSFTGTNITDSEKEEAISRLIPRFEQAFEMIDALTVATGNITIKFYKAADGAAADSGHNYNLYYNPYGDNTRSVFIHEFGHNYMSYGNDMIKFMEFATDIHGARNRWIDSHNYPLISSARYDLVDDCLCLLGFEYSGRD